MKNNVAADLHSGSIFQVVDDVNGNLDIRASTFTGSSNAGSVQAATHPGIYVEAKDKVGSVGVTIASRTFE